MKNNVCMYAFIYLFIHLHACMQSIVVKIAYNSIQNYNLLYFLYAGICI